MTLIKKSTLCAVIFLCSNAAFASTFITITGAPYSIEVDGRFGEDMVSLVKSLVNNSPIFRKRAVATIENFNKDKKLITQFKIWYDNSNNYPNGEAYVTNTDLTIYFTNKLFTLDGNGDPTYFKKEHEVMATLLVHELGHLDPRNDIAEYTDIFDSSLKRNSTYGDHDPMHGQYIMGITNEYFSNTNRRPSMNLCAGIYSKGTILSNYKVNATQLIKKIGSDKEFVEYDTATSVVKHTESAFNVAQGETLNVIYMRILTNLSAQNFSAVTGDLVKLADVKGNISIKFMNTTQANLHYIISPLEWITDLLMYETFDYRLGGLDQQITLDIQLKQNIVNYKNSINGRFPRIENSLKTSAQKFFLNYFI